METITYKEPVYRAIAGKLLAIENCVKSGNSEWRERHEEKLAEIMDTAPSGSGIDNGVKLLVDECGKEKLVFSCDFHHMDENGYYDGWSEHKVIVRPSLFFGLSITITGRNRNDIKEILEETMAYWLKEEH